MCHNASQQLIYSQTHILNTEEWLYTALYSKRQSIVIWRQGELSHNMLTRMHTHPKSRASSSWILTIMFVYRAKERLFVGSWVSLWGRAGERLVQTSALPAINSPCCYHGHHQRRNINERQKGEWGGGREQPDRRREGGGEEVGSRGSLGMNMEVLLLLPAGRLAISPLSSG